MYYRLHDLLPRRRRRRRRHNNNQIEFSGHRDRWRCASNDRVDFIE